MKRHQYMLARVPARVPRPAGDAAEEEAFARRCATVFKGSAFVPTTMENPEFARLREGTYEPPAGWRVRSHTRNGSEFSLLLERELDDDHPYR